MADLDADRRQPGFEALSVPVRGSVRLRIMLFAPDYADHRPGPGPRFDWPRPVRWTDTIEGRRFAWRGDRRRLDELPDNPVAFMLAARLGCADLADRSGLRGDLLLAGVDAHGRPTDVPLQVVHAAQRTGLIPSWVQDPVGAGT